MRIMRIFGYYRDEVKYRKRQQRLKVIGVFLITFTALILIGHMFIWSL